MKKTILLLFLIIATFFNPKLSAQQFDGGLVVGLTGSQIDGDSNSGYHKAGLVFGGWVLAHVGERFGIQSGMQYMGKGAKKLINPDINDYTSFKTSLHYVEVPCIATYKINQKVNAEIGLGCGYLVDDSKEWEGSPLPEDIGSKNNFDWSAKIGLRYCFTEHWYTNLRLSYSMLPISSHPNQFNNVVEISISYQIN